MLEAEASPGRSTRLARRWSAAMAGGPRSPSASDAGQRCVPSGSASVARIERRGQSGEQGIIVARRWPRTAAPRAIRRAPRRRRPTRAAHRARSSAEQPLASASRSASSSRPSRHVHHRIGVRRERLARGRAAGSAGDRRRPAGPAALAVGVQLGEARGRIAERPDQPQRVARLRRPSAPAHGAGACRSRSGPSTRGAPGGKRDRVAADQRQAIAFARRLDPAEEGLFPFAVAADGQRQQGRARAPRPWRRGRSN